MDDLGRLVFGPVPSRRLGQSLGINNIPPKSCSYSCIYCQIGKTRQITIARKPFYKPESILKQVKKKVQKAALKDEHINYLTFVPDGEPTLDINLGKELALLDQLEIPRAVITNASLIWQEKVKEELLLADFVSIKVDANSEELWRRINRPHKQLKFDAILEGINRFSKEFKGTLVSETMLVDGINYEDESEKIADFLLSLKNLDKAFVAIPTRPPTEKWIKPPKEEIVNIIFQKFQNKLGTNRVEYLIGYEGNAFAFTGNVEEDLLSITAVHPMREEAVKEFLRKANATWEVVDKLLFEEKLTFLEYEGNPYFLRKFSNRIQN
jgi:wyosine [tRNA(Phe)-imidazoG37] synthetase (radical SAM superfamily)